MAGAGKREAGDGGPRSAAPSTRGRIRAATAASFALSFAACGASRHVCPAGALEAAAGSDPLAAAWRIGGTIDDAATRAAVLTDVAARFASRGEPGLSACAADAARQALDRAAGVDSLERWVRGRAAAGDAERSEDLISFATDPHLRLRLRLAAVDGGREGGRLDEARSRLAGLRDAAREAAPGEREAARAFFDQRLDAAFRLAALGRLDDARDAGRRALRERSPVWDRDVPRDRLADLERALAADRAGAGPTPGGPGTAPERRTVLPVFLPGSEPDVPWRLPRPHESPNRVLFRIAAVDLARALAAAGRCEDALELARSVAEVDPIQARFGDVPEELVSVAVSCGATDRDAAERVLDRAFRGASPGAGDEVLADEGARFEPMALLAFAYAEVGLAEKARRAAGLAMDHATMARRPDDAARFYRRLAAAVVESPRPTSLAALALELCAHQTREPDRFLRAEALAACGEAALAAGLRYHAIPVLSDGQADLGRPPPPTARPSADPDAPRREAVSWSRFLRRLGAVYLRARDTVRARQTAVEGRRVVTDLAALSPADALAEAIAWLPTAALLKETALTKAFGDLARAETEGLPDPRARSLAFVALAAAQARSGLAALARQTAAEGPAPADRLLAGLRLAEAIFATSPFATSPFATSPSTSPTPSADASAAAREALAWSLRLAKESPPPDVPPWLVLSISSLGHPLLALEASSLDRDPARRATSLAFVASSLGLAVPPLTEAQRALLLP